MQRITNRNNDGTISVDIEDVLAERLAFYEDLYNEIVNGHTCSNCFKRVDCQYTPKWGEPARINCFAWKEEEQGLENEQR